jgi:hypothetical protein
MNCEVTIKGNRETRTGCGPFGLVSDILQPEESGLYLKDQATGFVYLVDVALDETIVLRSTSNPALAISRLSPGCHLVECDEYGKELV